MAIQIVRTPKTHPLNTTVLQVGELYSFLRETEEGIENVYAPLYDVNVPAEFNGSEQWRAYLSPIKDQKECGGCYAYASASCLADRYNLYGSLNLDLSATKIILCDLVGQSLDNISNSEKEAEVNRNVTSEFGCQGNSLFEAWRYLYNIGTVTTKCFPENVNKPCEKVMGQFYDSCDGGDSPAVYYRALSVYLIRGTPLVEGSEYYIRNNIYAHGPITTTITIYENFYTFDPTTEIYRPKGRYLSGHAIVIDGWGIENGVKFWWVRNSWGPGWGIRGYFKLERGVDSCTCESDVITGGPVPAKHSLFGDVYKVSEISNIISSTYTPFGGIDPNTGVSNRHLSYSRYANWPPNKLSAPTNFVAGALGEGFLEEGSGATGFFGIVIVLSILSIVSIILVSRK